LFLIMVATMKKIIKYPKITSAAHSIKLPPFYFLI